MYPLPTVSSTSCSSSLHVCVRHACKKKKKSLLVAKKKKKKKKRMDAELLFSVVCFFFFFTSVFHLLPSPSHFPPDLNERKASTLSIVEGCLERTCERKSILRRMSLELCWLGQQFIIIDDVVYIVAHD